MTQRRSMVADGVVAAAAGVFVGGALFDIWPETARRLGFDTATIMILSGVVLWAVLKAITNHYSNHRLTIVTVAAFWLHSALEGAVTALSFSISQTVGWLVVGAMVLHLFPELLALVGLLKGEGVSVRRSVRVDLVSLLWLIVSFVIVRYVMSGVSETNLIRLGALTGGAFLYIGIVSVSKRPKTLATLLAFIAGLLLAGGWNLWFGARF